MRRRLVVPALLAAASLLGACAGKPPLVAAAADALRGDGGPSPLDSLPPTAADARVVATLVRDYLRVRPAGRAPNPYWRRDEQARFPRFDVAGMWTYGARAFRERYGAFRVEVAPPPPGTEPGVLMAVVHFAPRERRATKAASVRLFARREGGQWRLGAALPQLTRGWPERRIGHVVFRTQAGMPFDSARGVAAARYTDSLAAAFGVAPPEEILYVQARTPAEALRAMGIADDDRRMGGVHFGRNRLIVSGGGERDPFVWHELAHAVFNEVVEHDLVHRLVVEGAAQWVSWRMDPRGEWSGRRVARAALATRPTLGLRDVAQQPEADGTFYASGAWVVGRVHDAAGVSGVRDLMRAGRVHDEVLSVARRHLRLSQAQLDAAWREWANGAGNSYGW